MNPFVNSWMFTPAPRKKNKNPSLKSARGFTLGQNVNKHQAVPWRWRKRGAINTAMIGHQISPLSQQIIAVSVVCSEGGQKKINFVAQKRATGPRSRASWFSGLRGRSGQTCNFWNSHPAAYFFLCQLLAAGSACGPLDLTKVACGPRLASVCVKCSSQKNNTVQLVSIVSVVIWGRLEKQNTSVCWWRTSLENAAVHCKNLTRRFYFKSRTLVALKQVNK